MTMLAALLLLQAATPAPEPFPLGTLPKQALPARGCAAYLFTVGDTPALVAVASTQPALLRVALAGTITDLPRAVQRGAVAQGFSASTDYAGTAANATLDMTIVERSDLKDGATVPNATLQIERSGKDSVAIPLTGLIGCATGPKD